jgi:hypothetical protein
LTPAAGFGLNRHRSCSSSQLRPGPSGRGFSLHDFNLISTLIEKTILVEPGDRGVLHVHSHFKSHCLAGQRSDVGRLRRLSTGNTSRSVGPQMLCRLPTAELRAPARISTAPGCTSIRAATWTAAEIVERRTSEGFVLGADEIGAGAFHCGGRVQAKSLPIPPSLRHCYWRTEGHVVASWSPDRRP